MLYALCVLSLRRFLLYLRTKRHGGDTLSFVSSCLLQTFRPFPSITFPTNHNHDLLTSTSLRGVADTGRVGNAYENARQQTVDPGADLLQVLRFLRRAEMRAKVGATSV